MPTYRSDKPDELGLKVLSCMLSGDSNRVIATKLKKPMSTIQRRTRQLIEDGLIKTRYELDYNRFGFKKGLLHVYLSNGNSQEILEKLTLHEYIISASIHIGNSDILAEYACFDSVELLKLIADVKKMPHIQKVVWSEEVTFRIAEKPPMPVFEKRAQAVK